jgi:hypothetical protein
MTRELPISIRAYAKQLNVDEKAVRKAIEEGKIKKGYNKKIKKIIPSKANVEWGSLHQVIKPQRGVSRAKVIEKLEKQQQQKPVELPPKDSEKPNKKGESIDELFKSYTYSELINSIFITPDLQYSEAIRLKEILAIANERMELEEKQGILVRRADVDKSLYKLGDLIKKSFLNISARVVPEMRAAGTDVEATNILNSEIKLVLSSIANMRYDPGGNNS